ncbi:uncharacterized protein LOC110516601 isoform X2 [Oncorhynchus mykiss]|uniref:uncharacterized protein LOC110516601 isoform X2 n=1 Tax=Oncorhynchus mykiss TaxID=8022 RepID=UPI001878DBAC|nr:uncharacterized protein LOC110516601 isoform X2 [Oncorhynchus mykiss]
MMMRMKLTFLLAILLFQLTISVKGGTSASKPAQQADKQNPPFARRNSAPAALNHAPPDRSPDLGRRNSAPAALSSASLYTFGDIIRFNRKKGIIPYNHYAIYVGNHDITGKTPGQDIFHFSGELTEPRNADCVFDSLADVTKDSTPVVQTEWDGIDLPRRTEAGMIEQIKRFHNNCKGEYSVISANCEHLVTFIQFAYPVCEQKDTSTCIEYLAKQLCKASSTLFTNKRGRGRRGLGLLQDETRANQGAPAA